MQAIIEKKKILTFSISLRTLALLAFRIVLEHDGYECVPKDENERDDCDS